MGCWGTGPFDSDDALDYLGELVDSHPVERVSAVSEAIVACHRTPPDELIESFEATMAVVAAELIAVAIGKPHAECTRAAADPATSEDGNTIGEAARWATSPDAAKQLRDSKLRTTARQVVLRVTESSELKELWDDANDMAAWQSGLRNLASRLA